MVVVNTIMGWVSFIVTILTWLNVFWEAFFTFIDAPPQVVDYFSTLRQRLFEERVHSKKRKRDLSQNGRTRRHSHGNDPDDASPKVLYDAIKDTVHDFKNVERPFFTPPHTEGREKDLDWSYDTSQSSYFCFLSQRFKWIHSRKKIMDVERRLNSLQMRRIAFEVSENNTMLAEMLGIMRRNEERLSAIEHRLRMSQSG